MGRSSEFGTSLVCAASRKLQVASFRGEASEMDKSPETQRPESMVT